MSDDKKKRKSGRIRAKELGWEELRIMIKPEDKTTIDEAANNLGVTRAELLRRFAGLFRKSKGNDETGKKQGESGNN